MGETGLGWWQQDCGTQAKRYSAMAGLSRLGKSILCFFSPKIVVISSPQSLFLICFCKKDEDSYHPKMFLLYLETSTAPLGPSWTLAFLQERLGIHLAMPSSFVAGLSLRFLSSFCPPRSFQRPLFKFAIFRRWLEAISLKEINMPIYSGKKNSLLKPSKETTDIYTIYMR